MSEAVRAGLKKTKFFRVAVAGKTIDGREITDEQINEMAETYSTETYGARINLEHLLSYSVNSEFSTYGDVIALKAEDVTINGNNTRALYAQFAVSEGLIKINHANKKIYPSIEIAPNFADTGKAYLIGLACTDTPASIGTEAFFFSRSFNIETLISTPIESDINFSQLENNADENRVSIAKFVADLFKKKEKESFNRQELEGAFTEIANAIDEREIELTATLTTQEAELNRLEQAFSSLKENLSQEPITHTFTPHIELDNPDSDGLIKPEY